MKEWIKEWLPYVVIIVGIILLRTYIVAPVQVDGTSMEPTLQNNQILLLKKYDNDYSRFKIVVLNYDEEKLVKRIVGLPGEHIAYKNNELYINGEKVEETFGRKDIADFDLEQIGYDVIPDDYYFVIGDNRSNSLDSRYLGLFKKSEIEGTVNFSLFPFSKFGKIK